jgi:hypothetical protein
MFSKQFPAFRRVFGYESWVFEDRGRDRDGDFGGPVEAATIHVRREGTGK